MKHDACAYVKRGPSTFSWMMRRSLWLGLRLGLLLGIGFAVFKTVQSRRTLKEPATPPPWEPLTPREAPKPPPRPEPVAENPPTWQEVPTQVAEPEPAPAPPPVFEKPAPAPAPAPAPVEEPVEEAAIPSVPDPGLDVPVAPVRKVAKAAKKAAKKVAKKAAAAKKAVAAPPQPWVDPDGGVCPPSHPVKGKLASRLFHLPGMFAYDRTKADRCYLDAAAAEADGLTRAKR